MDDRINEIRENLAYTQSNNSKNVYPRARFRYDITFELPPPAKFIL